MSGHTADCANKRLGDEPENFAFATITASTESAETAYDNYNAIPIVKYIQTRYPTPISEDWCAPNVELWLMQANEENPITIKFRETKVEVGMLCLVGH